MNVTESSSSSYSGPVTYKEPADKELKSLLKFYRKALSQEERQELPDIRSLSTFLKASPEKKSAAYKMALEIKACDCLLHQNPKSAAKLAQKLFKLEKNEKTHRLLASIYAEMASQYRAEARSTSHTKTNKEEEAHQFFKREVKQYRKERSVSGKPFQTVEIFLTKFPRKQISDEVYAEALVARSEMFLTMKSAKDAIKDLKEAEKLNPNSKTVLKQLAKVYDRVAQAHETAATGVEDIPDWALDF
ncbi:hypothetical protein [Criblamydia sequanensis]|uniref:Uncharacterized protein n=1 Tax=Candidatus Criblamydia sequanensis CRIB-18 TaxID=1437425 RepID=A0A090D270_9BACT|nr:hypothetical protein [Criblamydia sequanensis]CDR34103.1 hypothetical protein CSEC_1283 [Criblamydia sequanensis CRIB-18]